MPAVPPSEAVTLGAPLACVTAMAELRLAPLLASGHARGHRRIIECATSNTTRDTIDPHRISVFPFFFFFFFF